MKELITNFSLIKENIKFNEEDLVIISDKGKRFNILNCPHKVKQEQIHYRQNIIVDCIKSLISLKFKSKYKTGQALETINTTIDNILCTITSLLIDIEKYKFTAKLQNEEVRDLEGYTEFINNEDILNINIKQHIYNEVMNKILSEDSEFFCYFVQEAFIRSVGDTLIPFITPILESRGYKISRLKKETA